MEHSNLYSRFVDHLKASNLIQKNQHVLVAVSGGRDSMCLLALLRRLAPEWDLTLTAAHVNHRIRQAADKDQSFVESVTREWKIPCRTEVLDPTTRENGESPEAWARLHRYQALQAIQQTVGASVLVTAHHGNDQVETLLYRLSTGSGFHGLRGIRPRQGSLIRPLLPFTRSDIETYVQVKGIPFREDASNRDETIPRNFLRHRLVKRWEKFNPSIVPAFQAVSEQMEELGESLDFAVQRILPEIAEAVNKDHWVLEASRLSALPLMLRTAVIRKLTGKGDRTWRRYHWNQLKTFLNQAHTGDLHNLDNGWELLKDRQQWVLRHMDYSLPSIQNVKPGETADWEEYSFTWDRVQEGDIRKANPLKETIDAGRITTGDLTVRVWKPGDAFTPLGMKGTRKISDFLTDLKLDRFSKRTQRVVTSGEDIIWVCGHRISDQVKITGRTTQFAELSLIPRVG